MNKHMSVEHRNDKGGFDCPIPECKSTFQKVTFLIRHHRLVLLGILFSVTFCRHISLKFFGNKVGFFSSCKGIFAYF